MHILADLIAMVCIFVLIIVLKTATRGTVIILFFSLNLYIENLDSRIHFRVGRHAKKTLFIKVKTDDNNFKE